MSQPSITPRPAATLILARDTAHGIEVLMVRRSHQASFMAGAYVFPGGAIDASDGREDILACCADMDDVAASRWLNLESGGLAFFVGAIRECFEESGLLLAVDARGGLVKIDGPAMARDYGALRQKLAAGGLTLAELCRDRKLRLAVDCLAYFSHWITPVALARRFDTRFFIAIAPPDQIPSHDEAETVDHVWVRPAEAMERHARGEFPLMFATIKTLEALACFDDTAALMDHARAPRIIAPLLPRIATGRGGRRALIRDDYAYAEVGKLDPEGKGSASYELLPGVVTQLSPALRRITAPNASFMTGPGTNSYLLGAGEEIAVIDPGPAIEVHVQTLVEEARGRIRWILVTHTHPDHSPAAALLWAHTGAELIGMPPPPHERQDRSFKPDRVLAHGERITVAGCRLRSIHTPGHASNHLCYLLEEERLLFTGDHIMQGSTVVISPPDGDMTAYQRSLRLLLAEDIEWLAPGHGFLMDKPHLLVERLLLHRLGRENKVYNALSELGAATVEALLPIVYDDVPVRLHRVAERSLLAHLIKLKGEERVSEKEGRWRV